MRELIYSLRRALAYTTLPYFRHELPGWQRLAGMIGLPIRHQGLWAKAKPKTIRGKRHGYLMTLNMKDWSERLTYFLGRYYDIAIDRLMEIAVAEGDTFIDVGANAGMVTLMAASRIGAKGKVFAFEPNPAMVDQLRALVSGNELGNVTIYAMGLSDADDELELKVFCGSSGWATFGLPGPAHRDAAYELVTVPVSRGDDVVPSQFTSPVVLKVDVEGYECRAIRGLERFIARHKPLIVTEIEPDLLRQAGSSAEELFSTLAGWGFTCYQYDIGDDDLTQPVRLKRVALAENISRKDVVWLHPESEHARRLASATTEAISQ